MNPSSHLLNALFDSAPDAVLVVDDAHAIRLVNRQAEVLFGWKQEALAGMPLRTLVSHDLRERHDQLVDGFFSAPTNRLMGAGLELWALTSDGTRIPVDIALSPLQLDEQSYVACAVRDLRERRGTPRASVAPAASADHRVNESALQAMFGAGLSLSASLEDFGTEVSRERVERAAEDLRTAVADLRALLEGHDRASGGGGA